jgi:hypothetical protein
MFGRLDQGETMGIIQLRKGKVKRIYLLLNNISWLTFGIIVSRSSLFLLCIRKYIVTYFSLKNIKKSITNHEHEKYQFLKGRFRTIILLILLSSLPPSPFPSLPFPSFLPSFLPSSLFLFLTFSFLFS